jgi:hypothetical protein
MLWRSRRWWCVGYDTAHQGLRCCGRFVCFVNRRLTLIATKVNFETFTLVFFNLVVAKTNHLKVRGLHLRVGYYQYTNFGGEFNFTHGSSLLVE